MLGEFRVPKCQALVIIYKLPFLSVAGSIVVRISRCQVSLTSEMSRFQFWFHMGGRYYKGYPRSIDAAFRALLELG